MKTYLVRCGYRIDDGMNYAMPTHWIDVKVIAENTAEARLQAIERVHLQKEDVSHVTPNTVREVTS